MNTYFYMIHDLNKKYIFPHSNIILKGCTVSNLMRIRDDNCKKYFNVQCT